MISCEPNSAFKKASQSPTAFQVIALSLGALLIVVSFLSVKYLVSHAYHAHDHDGLNGSCTTCSHLLSAENLLKTLSVGMVATTPAASVLFGALLSQRDIAARDISSTLVSLKVRLNC